MSRLKLADILTPKVNTVSPERPVHEVLTIMREQGISSVVVTERQRPVGIFTERDVVMLAYHRRNPESIAVGEVMGRPPITAPPEMDYQEAYRFINEQQVRHLIVVDSEGKLAGIVTEDGFLKHLGSEFLVRLKDVGALMTQKVLTLPEDATVEDGIRLMARERISCIVVENKGLPSGILTERDLVKLGSIPELISSRSLRAIMSRPVHSATADTALTEAIRIMDQAGIRRLVVVDDKNSIIGLMTRHDIVKQLYDRQILHLQTALNASEHELQLLQQQLQFERSLRKTEQALRESQNRLELALEAGSVGTWDWDIPSDRMIADERLAKLFAVDVEQASRGRPVAEYFAAVHEDDLKGVRTLMDRAMQSGEPFMAQFRVQGPDGMHWVDARGKVKFNRAGEAVRFLGALSDVSEQKKTRQQLDRNERLLGTLASLSPVSIFRNDAQGNCIYVNRTTERMVGLPAEECLGDGWLNTLHESDRDRVLGEWRRAAESGGTFRCEFRFHHTDGKDVWVIGEALPETDENGGVMGFVGSLTDVTELKKKEDELSVREEQLLHAQAVGRLGSWKYDLLAQEFRVSAEFMRIHGLDAYRYPADEIFRFAPQEDAMAIQAALERALSSEGRYEIEHRIVRRDTGETRWIRTRGEVKRGPDDAPISVAGTAQDITEQKQAEMALRESEARHRGVVEDTPVMLCRFQPSGEITFVNQAYCECFGLSAEELVGSSFLSLIPEADRDRVMSDITLLTIEQPTQSHEHRVLSPNGGIGWQRWTNRAIFDAQGRLTCYQAIGEDITERKRMEEERTQILDNAHDLICIAGLDGFLRYINPAWHSILGYGTSELMRRPYIELVNTEDRAKTLAQVEGLPKNQQIVDFRNRIVAKDGGVRTISWKARMAPGEDFFYAFGSDITERERAQAALLESERRLATLMGNLPGMAYRCLNDYCWTMEFVSQGCMRLTGYEPSSLVNNQDIAYLELVVPEDVERIRAEIRQAIAAGSSFELVYRIQHKNGELRWVLEKGQLVSRDTDPRGILEGFVSDITETMRAEVEIRKLAQTVEQSPESVIITNLKPEIEYVNASFERNTGYDRNEVMGKNPRILQAGKTPGQIYRDMWETLLKGEIWQGEFVNRRKDGSEFTEFAIISPIRQVDGSITHYVAMKEDITEKKLLAEELERHRHHLEELVEERTAQLAEARKRAEVANQTKSAFLANMSHEIRTPMNAILGLTHLMQRSEPSATQADSLGKIDSAGRHLLSIINDILDISKIESGKFELEQTDFDLTSVFDYVQSLMRPQILDKGLAFKIDLNGTPRRLRGDPTRLRQALLNFVSNAVKFTEHGSISLRAELLENGGSELLVRFEVQDTGIGIDEEKLPSLFKAFEQADLSTTRRHGGTGLGLAITRHLANLMGGEAGASSRPGEGSTFWFTARLCLAHAVSPSRTVKSPGDAEELLRTQCAGARLLLVEDNDVNRQVAYELLRGVNLEVDSAENGRIALEKVQASHYDLILMDIQMPEMDGIEATRVLRSDARYRDLPILAMTANIFEDDRQACLDAGMEDFVAKPVNPEVLFSTLAKWLPRKSSAAGNVVLPPSANTGVMLSNQQELYERLQDIDGLDVETGRKNLRGDIGSLVRLLKQFVAIHGEDANRLRTCLDERDPDPARHIAHSLKGASGTLGLGRLYEAANALEEKLGSWANDAERPAIQELVKGLEMQQTKLRQGLARVAAGQVGADTALRTDPQKAAEVLARLRLLLEEDNTAANALFLDNTGLLLGTYGAVVEQLRQQIDAFDYLAALRTIESIRGGVDRG